MGLPGCQRKALLMAEVPSTAEIQIEIFRFKRKLLQNSACLLFAGLIWT